MDRHISSLGGTPRRIGSGSAQLPLQRNHGDRIQFPFQKHKPPRSRTTNDDTNRLCHSPLACRCFSIARASIGEHALPASGSILRQAPSEVALSFSEALVPSDTDAAVRGWGGGIVSSGKARVIGKEGEVKVPVKPLSPGKYRVEWYATSMDKRHAQGSYNFVVGTKEERRQLSRLVPGKRH